MKKKCRGTHIKILKFNNSFLTIMKMIDNLQWAKLKKIKKKCANSAQLFKKLNSKRSISTSSMKQKVAPMTLKNRTIRT